MQFNERMLSEREHKKESKKANQTKIFRWTKNKKTQNYFSCMFANNILPARFHCQAASEVISRLNVCARCFSQWEMINDHDSRRFTDSKIVLFI